MPCDDWLGHGWILSFEQVHETSPIWREADLFRPFLGFDQPLLDLAQTRHAGNLISLTFKLGKFPQQRLILISGSCFADTILSTDRKQHDARHLQPWL